MSKKERFVLSDGTSLNSRGYRIDINGIDLTRFEKNPVMLHDHNTDRIIGRWVDVQKKDQKLTAIPEFDIEDAEALTIAGKVERGFLKGASVGIIFREMDEIDGTFVVTKSELFEASIVTIPADSGAVRLYNDKLECLSFDELKLNIGRQGQRDPDFKGLYGQICATLRMDAHSSAESILNAIKALARTKSETEIEELGKLDAITVTEEKIYLKLLRNGQTEVLQIIADKKAEYEKKQNANLVELYNQNSDKILSSFTAAGWEELKKLGYEPVKKIVDSLPERLFLSKMVKGNVTHDFDWYRKNNPKELQDNPELRESLLKTYKQTVK